MQLLLLFNVDQSKDFVRCVIKIPVHLLQRGQVIRPELLRMLRHVRDRGAAEPCAVVNHYDRAAGVEILVCDDLFQPVVGDLVKEIESKLLRLCVPAVVAGVFRLLRPRESDCAQFDPADRLKVKFGVVCKKLGS